MLSSLLKKKPVVAIQAEKEYIDRFELINELGKGAQGIVYLQDTVNGEMSAQAGTGSDISAVMKRFHFHASDSDDIFNHAMKK